MGVRAVWNNVVIAESDDCVIVEGNYFFPLAHVRAEYFHPSDERTECPWKGRAHYFDLRVPGHVNEKAAYYYPEPLERFARYANFVAFWQGVEIEAEGPGIPEIDGTGAGAGSPLEFPSPTRAREPVHAGAVRDQESLYRLLREIPKTEIHLHLEAMASIETIFELMNRNQVSVPGIRGLEDLHARFQVGNLSEFISLFIHVIQPCVRHEKDFKFLTRDARAYLKRNNIHYAEIFFAPTKFLMNGMDFAIMVRVLEEESRLASAEDGVEMKFLVDVSRGYGPENAMKNLDLCLANRSEAIIGIGLGGAEAGNPAADYGAVFEKARKEGLRVVAHAGEDVGPESIWDAVRVLGAERIGHGLSAILDDELMDYLRDNRIVIEACPTSNVFTRKYIKQLAAHPIRRFFDHGIPVTVNTDDPTIFSIELADEYMNIHNHCGFSPGELIRLVENGIEATFMTDERKADFRARLNAAVDERRDTMEALWN